MHGFYIDGQLEEGSPHDVVSPGTGQVVARVAWANAEDATRALEAAQAAFPTWAAAGIDERAGWIARLRDAVVAAQVELRTAVQAETGKTWEQTEEDYQLLIDALEFYPEAFRGLTAESIDDSKAGYDHVLLREPVGVAVAFIAWNFPLLNLAYKIGPAMAAGCPIVIKPSAKTPLAAYLVGELCHSIGLPAGVVSILSGEDAVVGDALSSSTIPALLTLIGSNATARHIMRTGSTSIKRYSLELGGNAPAIVYEDADLDRAAEIIASLKFAHAGQVCVTPNRVLVHERVADELTSLLAERARATRVGVGAAGEFDMGPLIDAGSARRVGGLVDDALAAGAHLVSGGKAPVGAPTDAYLEPTIVAGVGPDMRVYREEIFGPVIALRTFGDEDDVLAWANDTEAGLTAYVFTQDEERIAAASAGLRFGEIQVNGVRYSIALPHGGFKQSGIGHDCSALALDDYLAYKRVSRPSVASGARTI
ncbi:MAG: aldehyde dehydrogenase family protein [Cellulomonas sp.]